VPFATKAPGDRPVFVAPVVDARDAGPRCRTSERGFPIVYGGDEFWDRPVPEMVGDVLTAAAGGEPAVRRGRRPRQRRGARAASRAGGVHARRHRGDLRLALVRRDRLRVQVLGPAGAGGKRPLLHEQVYGNRQVSDARTQAVSPYRLVGRSLQLTMQKLLPASTAATSRAAPCRSIVDGLGEQAAEATSPRR
jgi:hypothetical protein